MIINSGFIDAGQGKRDREREMSYETANGGALRSRSSRTHSKSMSHSTISRTAQHIERCSAAFSSINISVSEPLVLFLHI